MSKRDRAARAKGPADATDTADDQVGTVDTSDSDATESSTGSDAAARPSGKRSSSPRGKRAAAAKAQADGGGVALKERPRARETSTTGVSRNPFVRIWVFLTQVVGELRKVIWPTRSEMIRYTIIVLIFVVVMTAFISGIDLGFAKAVLWLFG